MIFECLTYLYTIHLSRFIVKTAEGEWKACNQNRDNFFTPAQRSLIVYQILSRMTFGRDVSATAHKLQAVSSSTEEDMSKVSKISDNFYIT